MKNFILSLAIITFLTSPIYSQREQEEGFKHRGKLEQLEKIKLIEALNLNEEVAVRFFARRNESKKEVQALEIKADDLLFELEKTFDSNEKNIDVKQKQLLNDFAKTREQIELKRQQFISSLNDILTTEQICKLVVFEKKFRDEIREVLFDKKRY